LPCINPCIFTTLLFVMPGEGRASTLFGADPQDVDGRDKPGHDGVNYQTNPNVPARRG
jgi:hypothetical protein